MFPLDDNFVFGDNFFSLGDNFFFAEGDKKNYSPKEKKITHQKTKLFIQRKHLYAYDMTFLCPPPLLFLCINRGKPYLLRINCTNIGYLLYSSSIFSLLSLSSKVCCESLYIWDTYKTTNKLAKTIY